MRKYGLAWILLAVVVAVACGGRPAPKSVADVRGYSTLSQRLNSTDVYEVMKSVFKDLSKVVHRHQGVVKDFAGDAIFAVWEHGVEAKAEMAVAACLAAREQYHTLQRTLEGLPDKYEEFRSIRMGWGITTGMVLAETVRKGGRNE